MKLKMILIMLITLASVLGTIYLVERHNNWIAPYMLGLATPVVCSCVYNFSIPTKKGK